MYFFYFLYNVRIPCTDIRTCRDSVVFHVRIYEACRDSVVLHVRIYEHVGRALYYMLNSRILAQYYREYSNIWHAHWRTLMTCLVVKQAKALFPIDVGIKRERETEHY